MSTSTVHIGLQGYLQTFDITTTPQILYSGYNVPGRYMLVFIKNGTNLLGGVDFVIDGTNLLLISYFGFKGVTKGAAPFFLGLSDDSNIIYLDYQDYSLLCRCEMDTIPFVSFKSFIIATQYSGENLYSVDTITENTIGKGITLDGNVETTTVTNGVGTFINKPGCFTWDLNNINNVISARRIGKIVYISCQSDLTLDTPIAENTMLEIAEITPSEKFGIDMLVTGSAIITCNNEYISTSVIMKNNIIKLLIPKLIEKLIHIEFSLTYIIA
jgi:hypothetical protein